MKDFRFSGKRFVSLSALVLFLSGCGSFTNLRVSKKLNSKKYKRVAVLVVRVGNTYPSTPANITLKTDYSVRVPKEQSTFGLSEDKIDVYIEDDERLKGSIPDYPNYKDHSLPEQKAKYFKNISREIFIAVRNTLEKKGYSVLGVNSISKNWDQKIPDMTVGKIVSRCKGKADTVLILHYMDVGNYYYNNIKYEVTAKGFSHIYYTVSMFDTATGEQVLFFKPSTVRLANAILKDPDNASNLEIYEKVRIEHEFPGMKMIVGRDRIDVISYTLTDKEVINFAMKYIKKGLVYNIGNYKFKWKGLEEVIP